MELAALHYQNTYLKYVADRAETPSSEPQFFGDQHLETLLPPPARLQGTLGEALTGTAPGQPFGLQELATVCHHTLGFTRLEATDLYALHRATPAPRCRYPVELHWFDPVQQGRYDPRRHALHPSSARVAATIEDLRAKGWQQGWVISGVPGRLQQLYGHFSCRLMLLTAGHVLGQLQAVVHAQGQHLKGWEMVPFEWPAPHTEFPLLALQMEEAPQHWKTTTGLKVPFGHAVMMRHSACNSHGNGVLPAAMPQSQQSLRDLLASVATAELQALCFHVYVLNVRGMQPGIYRLLAGGLQWERPLPAQLDDLFTIPGFQARHCSSVWFVSVPTPWLGQQGSLGVSQAHLLAGMGAQRLGLAAAAHQLFARPSGSYHDAHVDAQLHQHNTSRSVVYQVLVAHQRCPGFGIPLG